MRFSILALSAILTLGVSTPTFAKTSTGAPAARCKDSKGKFMKCAAAAPAPVAAAGTRCKDAKGKFTKCDAAVAPAMAAATKAKAKPVQCRDAKTSKFVKCGTPGAKPA